MTNLSSLLGDLHDEPSRPTPGAEPAAGDVDGPAQAQATGPPADLADAPGGPAAPAARRATPWPRDDDQVLPLRRRAVLRRR